MKLFSASLIIRKTQIRVQGAKYSHWSEWLSLNILKNKCQDFPGGAALRMHLPMQETQFGTMVSEDSTSVGPLSPHVPQLLSLYSRAPELQLLRPPTAAPGAWCSRARVQQPEPTTMRSLILTVKLESSPCSLQIERAGFLQPRPSATKDK